MQTEQKKPVVRRPIYSIPQIIYLSKSFKDCRPDPSKDVTGYEHWLKVVLTVCHDLSLTHPDFNQHAFKRTCGVV